jgi:hypothetical protein
MAYNTPDTIYHRTALRLKRQAAPLIEDAKKAESSLVFSALRMGSTLEAGDLEPIEGWDYSYDPWPGRAVREMSPLSEIAEEDMKELEEELASVRKEIARTASAVRKARARRRR